MEKMIASKLNTMNIILVVIASCLVITLIMHISDRIKMSNAIKKAPASEIQRKMEDAFQRYNGKELN